MFTLVFRGDSEAISPPPDHGARVSHCEQYACGRFSDLPSVSSKQCPWVLLHLEEEGDALLPSIWGEEGTEMAAQLTRSAFDRNPHGILSSSLILGLGAHTLGKHSFCQKQDSCPVYALA